MMELHTRLKHIHSEAEFRQLLEEHPGVQSHDRIKSIHNAYF